MVAELIENEKIEAYLEVIQELLPDVDFDDPSSLSSLESLIDQYLEEESHEPAFRTFLEGERAFYRGDFQEAIESYSAAKEIPQSALSCYRALGHLYASQDRVEEALAAVHKALSLNPDDLMANRLLEELSIEDEELSDREDHLEASTLSSSGSNRPLSSHDGDLPPYLSEEALFGHPSSDWSPLPDVVPLTANSLVEKVRLCQERREELLHRYVQESAVNAEERGSSLLVLDGWENSGMSPGATYLPELHHRGSHGLFIRWQGKGVAINPGPNFLHRFHQLGGSIGEIDFVIVTHRGQAANVEDLHLLNDQFNRVSGERHAIHYYLEEEAHRQVSHRLKPRYKQERYLVHALGRYLDSTEIERVALADGIELSYLYPQSVGGEGVLIRLDLAMRGELIDQRTRSVGYLSGCGWCREMGLLYRQCDLLFAGFGRTDIEDCEKERYLSSCLGYFGSSTLVQQVSPALLLLGEFDGTDGDLRVDVVAQLREEIHSWSQGTAILPAELGMRIDLRELQVHCAMSDRWVDCKEIRVVHPVRSFTPLQFISPSYLL
jgi:Tetratricopeptide repeat